MEEERGFSKRDLQYRDRRRVFIASSRDRLTRRTDRTRSLDNSRIRRQYTIVVESELGHQSPPTEGPGALWSYSQRPRGRRTRLRACKRAFQSRERTSYRRSSLVPRKFARTIFSGKNRKVSSWLRYKRLNLHHINTSKLKIQWLENRDFARDYDNEQLLL